MMLCRHDGFFMELDVETARQAVDAGWPPVLIYRCRNGHTLRGDDGPPTARARCIPRCAVCGAPLGGHKGGGAKMCSPACRKIVAARRQRAYDRGEPFILEAQAWYRGHVTAFLPPPPPPPASLDPFAGHWPRMMTEGFLRWHNLQERAL